MPLRNIVRIDEKLCDGCGECVFACKEGALTVANGKARLVHDFYCDGLGHCLGECPLGAISVEQREADPFDGLDRQTRHRAIQPRLRVLGAPEDAGPKTTGCQGATLRTLDVAASGGGPSSKLAHWPVQLRLVPAGAPFMAGADLLVCADCVPFAVPDFHEKYLAGRAVVVGCPKLDDLAEMDSRLCAVVDRAQPRRLTVVRMEVPCCGGIAEVALRAAAQEGMTFPVVEDVVALDGRTTTRKVR